MHACIACTIACENCATECLHEQDAKMMARCIELDRDCADICALAVRLMARGSEFAARICAVCAEVCDACAQECGKHDNEHCKRCAEACRKCAEECRKMAG
jgi:hypothetical protein